MEMNMSTNDSGHVFSLDGSLSLHTVQDGHSFTCLLRIHRYLSCFLWLIYLNETFSRKKHRQNKTRCHDRTERCMCSTLNQPQGSAHPGSNERRRVCPVVDINMGASVESSGCEQCAFRAGCLLKLMSKQVWKHAVWRSGWETYLKLCRTTWDREWDTVNGFAVGSPARLHTTTRLSKRPSKLISMQISSNACTLNYSSDSILLFSLGYWWFSSGFHEIGKRCLVVTFYLRLSPLPPPHTSP